MIFAHCSSAFSQSNSTKLNSRTSFSLINGFGDCYFEHKVYRNDESLKKVVRHNWNGLTMIIRYNKKGKPTRTRFKKGPVMSQAPPCHREND